MANDEGNRQPAAGISVGYIEAIKPRTKLIATGVALRNIHCGKCQKLLFRAEVPVNLEIKCRGCGHLNRW